MNCICLKCLKYILIVVSEFGKQPPRCVPMRMWLSRKQQPGCNHVQSVLFHTLIRYDIKKSTPHIYVFIFRMNCDRMSLTYARNETFTKNGGLYGKYYSYLAQYTIYLCAIAFNLTTSTKLVIKQTDHDDETEYDY